MKTRNLFILLPILVLTLGSCTKIKDALTIKQEVDFKISLPVTISEPLLKATTDHFSVIRTIDPASDETVAQYLDQIKDIEITTLTLTVSNISAAPIVLTEANLELSGTVNGTQIVVTIPMDGTYNNNDTKTIDGADLDNLKQMLNALVPVTATFSGHSDNTGVTFSLDATVNSVVTVRILN